MLITELGGTVKASTVNGEENQQNNDEKIFSFQRICAATSNFSIENKLGEGGFGPVYKVSSLSLSLSLLKFDHLFFFLVVNSNTYVFNPSDLHHST